MISTINNFQIFESSLNAFDLFYFCRANIGQSHVLIEDTFLLLIKVAVITTQFLVSRLNKALEMEN